MNETRKKYNNSKHHHGRAHFLLISHTLAALHERNIQIISLTILHNKRIRHDVTRPWTSSVCIGSCLAGALSATGTRLGADAHCFARLHLGLLEDLQGVT